MNRLFTSLGAGLLGISALTLHAQQTPGLPVTDHSGRQCYYYTSKGGESVFGILNRFGWDEAVFLEYNPGTSDIKKGDVVYYPLEATLPPASAVSLVAEESITPQEPAASEEASASTPSMPAAAEQPTAIMIEQAEPRVYREIRTSAPAPELMEVPAGSTLYQIARAHNTSVAQILRLNPGLKPDLLTPGMKLRITPGYPQPVSELRPVREKTVAGTRTYKVGTSDSWESIAAEARVPLNLLLKVNPEGELPAKGKKVRIPLLKDTIVERMVEVLDQREETAEGRRAIYDEVHGLPIARPLEITVLTASAADNHKRDNEFVRGMLLAIDALKATGGAMNLHVRRVEPSALTPTYLQNDSLLNASRVIITTFERDFPASLAEFADARGAQLINVFDAKSDLYAASPSVTQVLPPSAEFFTTCTDYLMNAKGKCHFLYVAEDEADGDCVSLLLLERLIREGKSYETVASYSDIAAYDYLPGRSYVIVSDLNKRAEIVKLLDDIEKIIDKNPAVQISVIGRPTWIVYAEALKAKMQKADTYIPSRFFMNQDDTRVTAFERTFTDTYGASPLKSFPGYAAMGYDIARFIIPALNGPGELSEAPAATGALQLDLSLSREQPWSGLLNSTVYLVHLTPYNTIDKIRL